MKGTIAFVPLAPGNKFNSQSLHPMKFQIKWMLVIKVTNVFESKKLLNAASMKKCKKGQQEEEDNRRGKGG